MKKNGIVSVIIITMIVLLLTGCGGSKTKEQTSENQDNTGNKNAPATTIRVGLLRIDDSFPFYVAREEGLFEKHGVNVELLEFSSARDQSTALQGGQLDVIMTDPVVTALSIKGGNDMRIVATALGADNSEGRFLIVSAPESNITEPAQLEGNTLAISNNTMMDFLARQYMKELGVDIEKVQLINMPDLMLRTTTLLEGKDIDAAILPDPLAAYAVMGGANAVIDDTKLQQNYSKSVVSATMECMDKQSEALQNMLLAYDEAIGLINANPDKYKELALQCANVPKDLHEIYRTPSFTVGDIVDAEYIALVCDWMVEQGLLEKSYTYEEMVSPRK